MRPAGQLLAALTATSLLIAPASDAGAAPDPDLPAIPKSARTPSAAARTITLVTGDKVMVRSQTGRPDDVKFAPGQGSGSTGAAISRTNGHTYVVPTSARSEILAGRLDVELFDVTTLIAQRYDDAASKVLPTIVEYTGDRTVSRRQAAQDKLAGTRRNRLLGSIGARGATVDKSRAGQFWRSVTSTSKAGLRVDREIARIRLDHRVRGTLDRSVPQIGAPAAWQRGLTGKGVKVAVLDTGIDAGHPDLTGKVATAQNFSESPDVTDKVGHGTHVAGTIAGSGAASGGSYKGVAPDSTLINGKVLSDDGYGFESGIIAGMEWAVAQGADVVNMSLGGGPTDGTDPMAEAINTLSASSGTLFVVSAGNCWFPEPQQVSSPASADAALAVANLERDGSLAESSCRGPRADDFSLKPEIAAPGSGIVAPRAAGTDIGEPVGEHYTTLTGTSMAAPHVSGTAALLVQHQPDLNAGQLKTRLMTTADPQAGAAVTGSGAGRVDADQATAGPVAADTAELEFGYLAWPHPAPAPVTKALTYRNSSTAPVTLDLAVQLDPGVTAAAPSLSATQLVVPAGGQATVDLTARFAAEHIGHVAGQVLATPAGGGAALVTTFGWYSAPEEYNLTIDLTGFDGQPTDAMIAVDRVDGQPLGIYEPIFTQDGTVTLRVPPGTYSAAADLFQEATDTTRARVALAVRPEFTVGADTTIGLDARKAKPVQIGVPARPDLRPEHLVTSYVRRGSDGLWTWAGLGLLTFRGRTDLYATPAAKPSVGSAEFSAGGRVDVPRYVARYTDGTEIPVLDLDYTALIDGTRTLLAADGGTALPAELTGVRGKLAVIALTDERIPEEQIDAAVEAGAAGVMFHYPAMAGVVQPWVTTSARIPIVSTSRAAAAELIRRASQGDTAVRITGVSWSPVTYDLLRAWPGGAVPDQPVLRPAQSEFATVDTVIGTHGDGPGQESVMEMRSGQTPFFAGTGYLIVPGQLVPGPRRRTSYVLGGPVQWSEAFIATDDWRNASTDWFSSWRSYRAGQRVEERWFTPAASTGLRDDGPIIRAVTRYPDWLGIALSPFTHGHGLYEPSYVPYGAPGTFAMKVSRNGEPLGTAEAPIAGYVVPPGPASFRVELDAQRELPWWKFSTRIRSEWEFRSEGTAEEEAPPLIAADVEVPQANIYNQVKTGVRTVITLGLRHQAESPTSAITAAKVELSYDGSTWKALPIRALGNGKYLATVTHPSTQAGKPVHLRVEGKDAAGGLVRQEITRAYGLTR